MEPEQYIFIINNRELGALVPFKAKFLTPNKFVNKNTTFYKTDYKTVQNGYEATIYTEKPCKIDLTKYIKTDEPTEEELNQTETIPINKVRTAEEKLADLRSILSSQIEWANDNKEDESLVYDELYDRFNDLSRGGFCAIVDILTEE